MSSLRRGFATALNAVGLGPRPAYDAMGPEFAGAVDATLADIPDIVRLEIPVFLEHREHHPQDFQKPVDEATVAKFYRHALFLENWGVAVFVVGGATIGYVAWVAYDQFEGRHALIHSIAVDPQARRKNVANALLAHAEARAAANGLTSLRANVWSHNEASRAFFAKNGFYPVAELMGRSVRDSASHSANETCD